MARVSASTLRKSSFRRFGAATPQSWTISTATEAKSCVHSSAPQEQVFAKLKHFLRKAAARTVETACLAIGNVLQLFRQNNAQATR